MRAENFNILDLIESLQGTCATISEKLPEEMDEDDLTEEDFDKIYNEIFCCETCGWWCEISEEDENNEGNCNDHKEE